MRFRALSGALLVRLIGPRRDQSVSLESNKDLEERRVDESNTSRGAVALIAREKISSCRLHKEQEGLVVSLEHCVM